MPDVQERRAEATASRAATSGMTGHDLLAQPPIMDSVDERRLDLIRKTVAKGATNADIASFLELAHKYDLDPWAKEIWCVRSPGKNGGEGQVLMVVGRDGLRKIAQRQGLLIDGDVVRQKDEFEVVRNADGSRGVAHSYKGGSDARGPIIGAWCEVRQRTTLARPGGVRGFFFAPMHEYRPTNENKLKYSPWGSQESVMILAAAERQALRQATPLGGLLAEGEDARIGDSPAQPERPLQELVEEWLPDAPTEVTHEALTLICRAAEVGHAMIADLTAAEMALKGQPLDTVHATLSHWRKELDALDEQAKMRAEEEGEVVQEADVVEDPGQDNDSPLAGAEADEQIAALESQALKKLDEADAARDAGDEATAEHLYGEAEKLREQAASAGQQELL